MKTRLFMMFMLLISAGLVACQPSTAVPEETAPPTAVAEEEHDHEAEAETLTLPALSAANLEGRLLRVVATTSLIGDVVAQIGGEHIELTTLMSAGQDPHSYIATPSDLRALSTADVIFVNGWDLEEGLASDIETIAADSEAIVVPISANVPPLAFGSDAHEGEEHADEEHEDEEHADEEHEDEEHADEHNHDGADPHVWFAVHNVETWAENTAVVLSALNPARAETFTANAEAYTAVLEALEAELAAELAAIPATNRKIVTNHDAFAYFAEEYDFEVVGTVIPSRSTLSEPSAQDLAGLIETMRRENLCVIFTETTVSDKLAETVAGELSDCTAVEIVQLHTGALGEPGSGIDSYVAFMRTNVTNVVNALR